MQWNSNRFVLTLSSSIGKKLIMAITGLGFCLFLVSHLAGNLVIYAGNDAFNSYAERLHALGPLIILAEIGLLFFISSWPRPKILIREISPGRNMDYTQKKKSNFSKN
jgi:succinate dehydrogenase/fumarate reductase cytochrome b subunit (b558 family)